MLPGAVPASSPVAGLMLGTGVDAPVPFHVPKIPPRATGYSFPAYRAARLSFRHNRLPVTAQSIMLGAVSPVPAAGSPVFLFPPFFQRVLIAERL